MKNKYDLTLCQSRLHTASETFVCQKKFGSGLIFCVFASVACILIGEDGEYEKKNGKTHAKISDSVCNGLYFVWQKIKTETEVEHGPFNFFEVNNISVSHCAKILLIPISSHSKFLNLQKFLQNAVALTWFISCWTTIVFWEIKIDLMHLKILFST